VARLAALVVSAARTLASAGLAADDARREAALLARHQLGWTHAHWLAHSDDDAPAGFVLQFDALIARRARREPVAQITGIREFYGREFKVTRDVLSPRPETEFVIEQALTWLTARGLRLTGASTIADIGTGSGCLAITLALEQPYGRVVATDVSPAALDVARDNAARHGLAYHIDFRETSLLDGMTGPFDLIVSNPPYVPEIDRASLAPEVTEFEPAQALFAGADGLDVIRALIPAAALALGSDGALVMEIGAGQAEAVSAIVAASGLTLEQIAPDLQGIPRVVVAGRHRRSPIG
jgi:release factor glutamine methyltransferase